MQIGGPFRDREGLEKSSSDGLVKEELIWQHRALMLPSPSPGSPRSMSAIGNGRDRQSGGREGTGEKKKGEWGDRGEKNREELFIPFCYRPS